MDFLSDLPSIPLAAWDVTRLPTMPGVYVVATDDCVLYVGRASDLRQRWRGHHRYDDLVRYSGASLYYWVCPPSFLEVVESALLGRLNPLLNASRPRHDYYAMPSLRSGPRRRLSVDLSPSAIHWLQWRAGRLKMSVDDYLEALASMFLDDAVEGEIED